MRRIRALIILSFAVLLTAPTFKHETLCEGFLPENDLQIPISVFQVGGMTEAEFHSVLDEIEKYYTPVIAAKGGVLRVNREWSNSTVNASAQRFGNTYTINMYGGLARHQVMTKDGFMLVACHEIGHHIGGAPKIASWWGSNDWATNEGGSDYFASLRCMRAMFNETDTLEFIKNAQIDPFLRTKCEEMYQTQAEENLCMRIGMAGFTGASLFHTMSGTTNPLRFDLPDPNVVTKTSDSHPKPQCRLDTYFQGGLCLHDMAVELSDNDPVVGTCNESTGQSSGLRPRCWFKP